MRTGIRPKPVPADATGRSQSLVTPTDIRIGDRQELPPWCPLRAHEPLPDLASPHAVSAVDGVPPPTGRRTCCCVALTSSTSQPGRRLWRSCSRRCPPPRSILRARSTPTARDGTSVVTVTRAVAAYRRCVLLSYDVRVGGGCTGACSTTRRCEHRILEQAPANVGAPD